MKNILPNLPPFIYTLLFICGLLIVFIFYILFNLDPESNSSKFYFTISLVLTTLMTIPTIRLLFLLLEDDPRDLRGHFRLYFSENILFSIFLGIVMTLKIYGFLNFTTVVSVVLLYLGLTFGYQKLKKGRRNRRN